MARMSPRPPYAGPVRAVVFDWAGTTVDHGSLAPLGVFLRAFGRHGLAPSREDARGPMGSHKRVHVATVLALPHVAAAFRAKHGRDATDEDVEAIYQDVLRLQIEVLPDFGAPVPGALETAAWLRARGVAIGSTTGYVRAMMDVLEPVARAHGWAPDVTIAADEVKAARPSPLMALAALVKLGAWPVQACVKVGDTPIDVDEGLNARMWTVAVAMTGNELGLTEAELAALPADERAARRERAHARLRATGAHYVIDGVADLPGVIADIERRLAAGESP